MAELLNTTIVLVLNRNWQAIDIRTPQDAFCQMATNVATACCIGVQLVESTQSAADLVCKFIFGRGLENPKGISAISPGLFRAGLARSYPE